MLSKHRANIKEAQLRTMLHIFNTFILLHLHHNKEADVFFRAKTKLFPRSFSALYAMKTPAYMVGEKAKKTRLTRVRCVACTRTKNLIYRLQQIGSPPRIASK